MYGLLMCDMYALFICDMYVSGMRDMYVGVSCRADPESQLLSMQGVSGVSETTLHRGGPREIRP